MIIPVRCMTCGHVIASAFQYYQLRRKEALGSTDASPVLNKGTTEEENVMGKVLDELNLDLMCCRRHFIGQVDLYLVI